MSQLETPVTISEKPSTAEFPLPAYDWNEQRRHPTIIAGSYTSGSIQTFNSQGKPSDSRSDNND